MVRVQKFWAKAAIVLLTLTCLLYPSEGDAHVCDYRPPAEFYPNHDLLQQCRLDAHTQPREPHTDFLKNVKSQFFGGKFHVWDKLQIAYFAIPKAASMTIRHVIKKAYGEPRQLRGNQLGEKELNYFKFTFIHDPLRHFLGSYGQAHRRDNSDAPQTGEKFYQGVDGFVEWVDHFLLPDRVRFDGHHCPQLSYLLETGVGHDHIPVLLDFIGYVLEPADWVKLNDIVNEKAAKQNKKEVDLTVCSNGSHSQPYLDAKEAIKQYPILVRKICSILFQEYTCFGLPFPDQCTDDAGLYNVTEYESWVL